MTPSPSPFAWSRSSARRLRAARAALALAAIPLTPDALALRRPDPRPVVEIHSALTPTLRAPCPTGSCRSVPMEALRDGRCPRGAGADVVVVSGHGQAAQPAEYLGASPSALAHAVACHGPRLIVLDVCEGFGLKLLRSLSDRGLDALVVGSVQALPPAGLSFGPAFFDAGRSTAERSAAVGAPAGVRLQRWRLSSSALDRAASAVAGMGPAALAARLETVLPNLVRAPLDADAEALVEVHPRRFRGAVR